MSGLEGAHGVVESPDGAQIYVASQSRPTVVAGPGGVTVFARAGNGALDFVQVLPQGAASVDGLQAARDIVVSPDGRHVYTANYGRTGTPIGPGGIAVFARNANDGTLSFVESHTDVMLGIRSTTSVEISPDGSTVYLTAQGALNVGALVVFSRDAQSGALEVLDVLVDDTEGIDGLGYAYSATASSDGAHLYVCAFQDPSNVGSGLAGAVSIFRVPEPASDTAALAAVAFLVGLARARTRFRSSGSR